MAYDHVLADRLRELLPMAQEKHMFGGVAFMERGNLVVGVLGEGLIARLGPEAAAAALDEDGVGPFDITGRPMKGWVMVGPDAMAEDEDLAKWVGRCQAFVGTLPAK